MNTLISRIKRVDELFRLRHAALSARVALGSAIGVLSGIAITAREEKVLEAAKVILEKRGLEMARRTATISGENL